ncbi:MAG: tetratricopeptide repeat protein [Verrucomicrobiia bacterium]
MRNERRILFAVCAVVIAVYVYTAHPGFVTSWSLNPADNYYNLLVQSFGAGQLSLKKDVPPGLSQLADPYDPAAYGAYSLLDISYYKGKLYLYFGPVPALLLFWPYVALTGSYLPQKDAVVIFCLVGFLASVGLLWAIRRRYFASVSIVVLVTGALALGLATLTPFLLARCEAKEVAVSCGYALTMLALAAVWKSLHESRERSGWLAAASLAYGLAVGARPNLLFGAVILLMPVAQAWRERQRIWTPLLAATGPILVVGLGLMLYNELRFDNPLEFGWHYQLTGYRQLTMHPFSIHNLWFNLRIYFLEPARWSHRFPFVHDIVLPPLPSGYTNVDEPFGVMTNIPLVWVAVAAPLAWRGRSRESCSLLRGFLTVLAFFFGICALTSGLFCGATNRYEVEFLPALVLLAVTGIFSVERALADQPVRRRIARCVWGVLLVFSVGFNLLAGVGRCAEADFELGIALGSVGHWKEMIKYYQRAVFLEPDFADAHYNLGVALWRTGHIQEAVQQYEQALQVNGNYTDAHNALGVALIEQGRTQEAIEHWERALRLKPDHAEAHYNLGVALWQEGEIQEAIGHFEQALRIRPEYAEAHNELGFALARVGRVPEAIEHLERALQINPDLASAHNNLGIDLAQTGRIPEAIQHLERALELNPNLADAHYNLGIALTQAGRIPEAIEHFENALRITPDLAEAHYNLGLALEKLGRTAEAIEHYQQALKLQPDFAPARSALTRLGAGQ